MSETEPTNATVVTASPAAAGRKTKAKAGAAARAPAKVEVPAAAAFDYTALGIAPADVERLQALTDEHRSMGRTDAEQTFSRGRLLNEAAAIILAEGHDEEPAQTATRHFNAWLKRECGITDRHARNFMAVDRNLQPFRTRMVAAALSPTMLFKLAPAESKRIEEVLGALETGRRLTVSEVVALVGGERASDTEEVPLADRGGVKALRELALDKARRGTAEVTDHLLGILRAICLELEPAERGRRVEKGKLADLIIKPARLARRELIQLTQCLRVDEHWDGSSVGISRERLPEGGWNELERLLDDIGSIHGWPDARELVSWLTGTVVPRLRWALEGAVPKDLGESLTGRLAAIAALSAKRKRAQNDNAEPAVASAA